MLEDHTRQSFPITNGNQHHQICRERERKQSKRARAYIRYFGSSFPKAKAPYTYNRVSGEGEYKGRGRGCWTSLHQHEPHGAHQYIINRTVSFMVCLTRTRPREDSTETITTQCLCWLFEPNLSSLANSTFCIYPFGRQGDDYMHCHNFNHFT